MISRLVSLAFVAIVSFSACHQEDKITVSIPQLLDSISMLHVQVDSISHISQKTKDSLNYWQVYSKPQAILKENGIAQPTRYITSHLENSSSLIPYKAILGGTMFIQRIALLGDHWAIASFEDGHIGGDMLLSYSVKDTSIQWKLIDATLND